ncbi:hypothetical protein DdX_02755 [Ditylenchus destructor]|uniref:Uncharacterized protein n=1 Tax=Ditylenchus destructor TaxID=166010 RepID=A0AAD4R6B6_9BILA|nr:hypothetical protein DdX_02755 [Ditylenchus destructor]
MIEAMQLIDKGLWNTACAVIADHIELKFLDSPHKDTVLKLLTYFRVLYSTRVEKYSSEAKYRAFSPEQESFWGINPANVDGIQNVSFDSDGDTDSNKENGNQTPIEI